MEKSRKSRMFATCPPSYEKRDILEKVLQNLHARSTIREL